MSLSGSVNTKRPLTQFCYEEGATFIANCNLEHRVDNEIHMWRLFDRNGNRPVTDSGHILCRDDSLQASSIVRHAPSTPTCVVRRAQ
ncbi:hypothetical protein EVAR_35505_1 [Eumeta japonica]|uniref:Uncharacterized protein n=1 Tax=Eumeta variegata TaxID=151549 RepID=A0A4C1X4R9_EUMVA|nr:hypothetical protein EVAR_35505_1 [Eumeta japonica]